MVERIGEVVALVRHRQPHRRFPPVVEHDLLGEPAAEVILEELAVGLDVHGETVEMIEAADIDAARGEALRLVLQRRLQLGRCLIPFGLVIELDDVAVGVAAAEGRPLPHVAVDPADIEAGALQRGDAALQRLLAARAQRHVLHARGLRRRQLERIALVIVPAAQVNRLALLAADGHAHDVNEEFQALIGLGRQQLHMAEMSQIEDRFGLHGFPPGHSWRSADRIASSGARLQRAQPPETVTRSAGLFVLMYK
ncbi:hypothetical protein AB7M75_002134 [Bradyrhizobium ottawaense]